jgi:nucleoside 2-deoxyribosyltransferase
MKNVYLAAPSEAERDFNSKLRGGARHKCVPVAGAIQRYPMHRQEAIFSKNLAAIERSDILVAVLDGK